ncbi:reverse transcriptase domain-containing protein [Tanacetum coccineum]
MRFPDIPSTSIKLMLFSFSLEGSARIWLEKEPPRSILTWDDLVSKFINLFFPPLKMTNLHTFYNALNANDQDSLNSAAGGNFLDKMPRECLRIIKSKSKVHNSRNKAVVAKVSSNSSTPGISPDVAALTTEVSELKNLMKTMLIDKQKAQAPASVKAVEQSCVTCGGAHSYKNCPATDGNVYQDNIQEYVSQAAAANFNKGNTNSRPPMVANQIRPPGFPPIQNNQNRFNQNQGNNFNQNRGTNFNQNRGSNFNQGQVYQPPTNQPPVYQAPTQQMQGVSKTDFENYVKANDVVLRNMQNQGQGLQNQMTNLTEMLSKFITSNTASSSNSGTLPSQTVTNPREHVNAITTRSGKTCEGPSTPLIPTPVVSTPKEPEQNPETSMDKVQKPSSESTAQVPPPEDHDSIFIEIPKPRAKKTVQEPISPEPNSYQPKLPYPERMKVREKDTPSAQQSRFMKLFKQLRLEIGLKDALIEMPKFNKWLSTLLRNKEKLEEIAITTVNVECSAIILNKVPEKLEDPGKFLIPCALQELDRTNALADSGASINLLPHSIYKQLGLGALKPTRMTLELANRSVTHPMGIAEDVVVRVDGFTFLADFVVVNFEPDPRVPIILGRPFLRTAKALIDLYEEKLTLRVGNDELVFYAEKSEKSKNKQFAHAISVIDFSKDEPFSGSTTNHSDALPPSSSPVKTSDNLEEFADELTLLKKGKDKEPTQEYILLPLHPHRTRIPVEDVANKVEQHQMTEDEQVLYDELAKMIAQEVVAKALDDATRQAFEEEKMNVASQKRAAQATSINKLSTVRSSVSTATTPYVSAASTPTGANASESSFVYLEGKIPINASTLPNADLPIDPNKPDLKDDSGAFSNDGIFNGSYDDENVGAVADFDNIDATINVSPIPTLKIHKDHPKDQILGDPKSTVQTRGKIQKASSAQQALKNPRPISKPYKMKAGLSSMQEVYKREERRYCCEKPKLRLGGHRVLNAGGQIVIMEGSLDRNQQQVDVQFLGRRLISWQCKKQTIMANSTTEAEYVAAANCYWASNYGSESEIGITDCYARDDKVIKIHTVSNIADLLTKGFNVTRFNFLVGKNFSGKVTPLFDSMLVNKTEDEGEASERPSDSQPIPSPPHLSEDQPQTQTDPSPRPSPSIAIPDSNPKGSGGNHGAGMPGVEIANAFLEKSSLDRNHCSAIVSNGIELGMTGIAGTFAEAVKAWKKLVLLRKSTPLISERWGSFESFEVEWGHFVLPSYSAKEYLTKKTNIAEKRC